MAPSNSKNKPKLVDIIKAQIESGEREPGALLEYDLPTEEPVYIDLLQHPDYQKEASELALQLYRPSTPEESVKDHDRLVRAEDLHEFQNYEMVKAIETDTRVENQSELMIGNTVEIRFNKNETAVEMSQTRAESIRVSESDNAGQSESKPASAVAEIASYVDFGLLGKKTKQGVFSLFSGLFSGLKDVLQIVNPKKEVKKTEAQLKKERTQKENKMISAQALKDAVAEAAGAKRDNLLNMQSRLGVAGMGTEAMNQYMGESRNTSSVEVNTYTISETARAVTEAQKIQKKRIEAMKQADTGPVINMQGAAEGGTAGGKANVSSVASAG